jgi:hypothetical protein
MGNGIHSIVNQKNGLFLFSSLALLWDTKSVAIKSGVSSSFGAGGGDYILVEISSIFSTKLIPIFVK